MANRNLGLDIIRSFAILMVMVSHGRVFISKYFRVDDLTYFGGLGVELFFVLSGYLIGRIILTEVVEGGARELGRFYVRRWFRTLPLYYAFMVFLLLIGRPFHWENFIFLQNFNMDALGVLGVSWSLSVEEWFYLLIPPFLLVTMSAVKQEQRKQAFLLSSLIVVILEISARLIYVWQSNPTFDFGVRMQIFLHLDALMLGVLAAGFKLYWPSHYRTAAKSRALFVTAIAGLVGAFFYYSSVRTGMNDSFFMRTFFLFWLDLCSIPLLLHFEQSVWVNGFFATSRVASGFRFVSVTSYALYLIHQELYRALLPKAVAWASTPVQAWISWIGTLIVIFIIAYLLHRIIERPFLLLRDRLTAHPQDEVNRRSLGNVL